MTWATLTTESYSLPIFLVIETALKSKRFLTRSLSFLVVSLIQGRKPLRRRLGQYIRSVILQFVEAVTYVCVYFKLVFLMLLQNVCLQ